MQNQISIWLIKRIQYKFTNCIYITVKSIMVCLSQDSIDFIWVRLWPAQPSFVCYDRPLIKRLTINNILVIAFALLWGKFFFILRHACSCLHLVLNYILKIHLLTTPLGSNVCKWTPFLLIASLIYPYASNTAVSWFEIPLTVPVKSLESFLWFLLFGYDN